MDISKCEKCVNWECHLHDEPCSQCLKEMHASGNKPNFTPQAFHFDQLNTAAKQRVMQETRSNIADEEGICKDSDEQLIQYINASGHIYMKDGEVIE